MTTDVALRDGSTVHVRSAGREDVDALAEFLDGLHVGCAVLLRSRSNAVRVA